MELLTNQLKKRILSKQWLILIEDTTYILARKKLNKETKEEAEKTNQIEETININALISILLGTVTNIGSSKLFPKSRGIKSKTSTLLDITVLMMFLTGSFFYSLSKASPTVDAIKKELIDNCDRSYIAQMKRIQRQYGISIKIQVNRFVLQSKIDEWKSRMEEALLG